MGVKLVKGNKRLIILLISLIMIGAVMLTNFLSFSSVETTVINQFKEKQQIETDYAASQIENHIYQVRDELTSLSRFPIMETVDINKCSGDMKIIHESIEGKISSLLRVDQTGQVVECSSPAYSNYIGLNIKNKDYFKVPKETNEPFISGVVWQGTNPQVIVSAPLFETTKYTPYPNFIGEFKGVLLSIIELNQLYNLHIASIADKENSFFLLVDLDTEDTIIRSNNIGDYSSIKDSISTKVNNNQNIIDDFNGYGKTIITSSKVALGSKTWKLFILNPIKNMGKDIQSVQNRHIFSLGFVAVVIMGVFFFVIRIYRSKEEIQEKLEKANVTLEKFGINIAVEKDKYAQADIILDTKKVYLIKDDEENNAHELFISTLNRGFAGLGISRDDPRELKKKYNLEKTSFIWLTKTKIEKIPCETDIENIFNLISEFVKKSEKSVILIDRLDYILTENEFEDVIKKIHALKDLVSSHECIVILSLNPELIEEPRLKAIEAETIDLYGKHLKKKVELSDMEMGILNYINEKNTTNKLASYKDITGNFKITKPTTRSKISKLQNLGLLQVEQKGRFKSIRITSAGRRIMG